MKRGDSSRLPIGSWVARQSGGLGPGVRSLRVGDLDVIKTEGQSVGVGVVIGPRRIEKVRPLKIFKVVRDRAVGAEFSSRGGAFRSRAVKGVNHIVRRHRVNARLAAIAIG